MFAAGEKIDEHVTKAYDGYHVISRWQFACVDQGPYQTLGEAFTILDGDELRAEVDEPSRFPGLYPKPHGRPLVGSNAGHDDAREWFMAKMKREDLFEEFIVEAEACR